MSPSPHFLPASLFDPDLLFIVPIHTVGKRAGWAGLPASPLPSPLSPSLRRLRDDVSDEHINYNNKTETQTPLPNISAVHSSSSTETQQLKWITQTKTGLLAAGFFSLLLPSLSRNKVINWTSEVSDRSMCSWRLEQQTSSDLWLWETCKAHGEDLWVNIFS